MNFTPGIDADIFIAGVGNIRITHRSDNNLQRALYPIPVYGDWMDFPGNYNEPDVTNLAEYVAELERKIRLRPASVLRALENTGNFVFNNPKKPGIIEKEVPLPGEVCTFECIGLCAALRELREKREKRAALGKRLTQRNKFKKDASN